MITIYVQRICIFSKAVLSLQILLVSGGYDESGWTWLDSTEILDPSLDSWSAGIALPHPMRGLRATNIENRVLLFGIKILFIFT